MQVPDLVLSHQMNLLLERQTAFYPAVTDKNEGGISKTYDGPVRSKSLDTINWIDCTR